MILPEENVLRLLPSTSLISLAVALVSIPHSEANAQANPLPPASGTEPATSSDDDMILVLAARVIGQLDAPQPPLLELAPEDIAAYGAGSIAELLQSLGPQVSSGRGRGGGGGTPIVMVNGVRISSFRELGSYPPESIDKVEVFSEEVAQRYGFSPDQRVVNIVLKPNFSSREIELEYGQPFKGGYSLQEVEATYLRINGANRLNLNLEINNSSPLTEAERDVIQTDGLAPALASDPDPAGFRTLVADSAGLEATANWSAKLDEAGTMLSVNAAYERSDSLRLQGLDSVVLIDPSGTSLLRTYNEGDPLKVDRREQSYSSGATLNGGLGDWQLTGTLDGTFSTTRSLIDRQADSTALVLAAAAGTLALDAALSAPTQAGFDEALSDTYTANGLLTAQGNPFLLPGGEVSMTFDAGYKWNRIESEDTRNPGVLTQLTRGRLNSGVNIGIPITSRDEDFGAFLGDISLNLNAGLDHLSDFGTLYDWSAGVNWGLTESLTLSVNYINRDEAPSLTQLGNPEIATFNVPVFDLANNETVLATLINGGNPLLLKQNQSDWKFGLVWQLPMPGNATFSVDYIRNHSNNVAGDLPTVTPAIEAAFPGRVVREGGRLVSVDNRPVNFAAQDIERLQFGLNMSGQIGEAAQGSPGGSVGGPRAANAIGMGAGGPPGGGQFNPQAFAQMRAQFCEAEPDALLALLNDALAAAAAGEAPPNGPDGQPLNIPPQMLERLKGPDGTIDPERFAAIRERICNAPAPGAAGQATAPPAAPGGFRPGRAGGGFRGLGRGLPGAGGSAGRWFINLQYTLELENTVLIAPGIPALDLLDGDALTGGGQPRHSLSARAGVFYKGFGLISFANYTGSSRLDGSGLPGSTDLFYGDYATINLRAFVDLGQQASLVEDVRLLNKTRIAIGIDNLFDARQRVVDSAGTVPLRFQPFLIDPVGRSFEIELRKLF